MTQVRQQRLPNGYGDAEYFQEWENMSMQIIYEKALYIHRVQVPPWLRTYPECRSGALCLGFQFLGLFV